MAYTLATELKIGKEQLAITIAHGTLGSHLGVAYWDELEKPRIMHLGWHKNLRVEDYPHPQMNWLCSVLNLSALASMQAVALISSMAEKYGNQATAASLDYGINLMAGHGAIKSDGVYEPGPDCDGFTCASIIAEIFAQIALPIVDLSTWPSTEKNKIWGRAIVCLLRALGATSEHVEKVESNVSGLRLRPEEFAAAAEVSSTSWPAPYDDVQKRADEIGGQIIKDCGPAHEPGEHYRHCVVTYRDDLARLEGKVNYKDATDAPEEATGDASSIAQDRPLGTVGEADAI